MEKIFHKETTDFIKAYYDETGFPYLLINL